MMVSNSCYFALVAVICLLFGSLVDLSQGFRPLHLNHLQGYCGASSISTSIKSRVCSLPISSIFSSTRRDAARVTDDGVVPCDIKVVGVGGGGGNAVRRMFDTGVRGAEFWAMNTDVQALGGFADSGIKTLHIGQEVTKGLGSGSIPENGRRSAEVSRDDIHRAIDGADLVFITAGMGGGTGSGAAPVVAEVARKAGALTVGVVTKPFAFEGTRRMDQANNAIKALKSEVDTLITISNERLLKIVPSDTPMQKAFAVADDVLRQAVVGISEIIIRPGLINVDFADVKAIMGHAGTALMGIGKGSGKMRAKEAAVAAISSPLLDFPIMKAKGVMFNIVGGRDLSLQEVDAAAEIIYEAVDTNANIKFGAMIDDSIKSGEITITVIATGFPEDSYFSTDSIRRQNGPNARGDASPPRGRATSFFGRLFGFGRSSTAVDGGAGSSNAASRSGGAAGVSIDRGFESVDSVMNRVAGASTSRQRPVLGGEGPSSSSPAVLGGTAGSRSAADSGDVPDFVRSLKRSSR